MYSTCSYNCLEHPTIVEPNSDVAGLGVIIGYIGTAAIVIILVTYNYLVSYDPLKDPFRKDETGQRSQRSVQFQPNPVDVHFLCFCREDLWEKIKRNRGKTRPESEFQNDDAGEASPKYVSRRDAMLIRCLLSVSDIQILTGLSILISGYIQLGCGLAAYHWRLLVYLAYFSSVTHQTCLTFLRRYLFLRPVERTWRLIGMGFLTSMLIVALSSIITYPWGNSFGETYLYRSPPDPPDFAVCYFAAGGDDGTGHVVWNILSGSVSNCLILFGFVVRVVKLHESLSVKIMGRFRRWLSAKLRLLLRRMNKSNNDHKSWVILKRDLIYRPLLALFLTLRLSLDVWTSMFLEIWWLLTTFHWGLLKFAATLTIFPQSFGRSAWSFGQVIPVVLLVAPLITIIEHRFADERLIAASIDPQPVTASNSQQNSLLPQTAITQGIGQPATKTEPNQTLRSLECEAATDLYGSAVQTNNNFNANLDSPCVGPSGVSALEVVPAADWAATDGVIDDPDHDYNNQWKWYGSFAFFTCFEIVVITIILIVLAFIPGADGDPPHFIIVLIPIAMIMLEWLPVNSVILSSSYVLHTFLMDEFVHANWPILSSLAIDRQAVSRWWNSIMIMAMMALQCMSVFYFYQPYYLIFPCLYVVVILVSFFVRLTSELFNWWSKDSRFTSRRLGR